MAFFIYVTDSLQNAPQNKYMTDRFYDIIYKNTGRHRDTRTGDEIAAETIKKLGLKIKVGDKDGCI